jgi:hypothetical protein
MTIPIGPETCVRVSPSVYARPFGDELVLLHFGRGEYFGLDDGGAEIGRRLERGETIGAIADALCVTFTVSREAAIQDVIDLVSDLKRESLLET